MNPYSEYSPRESHLDSRRVPTGDIRMSDSFFVTCPCGGEEVEIYVEEDVRGTFVQDCEVCCNPWRLRVRGRGEERSVDIARADGSE